MDLSETTNISQIWLIIGFNDESIKPNLVRNLRTKIERRQWLGFRHRQLGWWWTQSDVGRYGGGGVGRVLVDGGTVDGGVCWLLLLLMVVKLYVRKFS
ncbi:hypothetical protein Hanom_Chr14g01312561 [Helianthus anomalus]